MDRRVLVILNPVAGQARGAGWRPRVEQWLSAWPGTWAIREVPAEGSSRELAAGAARQDWDAVIVAGGDGTLNQVMNGLAPQMPLGIIPLGTANVFAQELGIRPGNGEAALRIIRDGHLRSVDVGRIDQHLFLLMAGIGFDAEVVKHVDLTLKNLIGGPAYVISALRTLQHYRSTRFRLIADGRAWRSRAYMLVVANAASYGGAVAVAPAAAMNDGWLDACLFRERHREGPLRHLHFLRQWWHVLVRRHAWDPELHGFRCRTLTVTSNPPVAIQVDGDPFGTTPAHIEILPGRLRVFAPATEATHP